MAGQKPYHELSVAEILSRSINLYLARFGYFLVPFLFTNSANGALWQFMDRFMPDFNFPLNFTEGFFLWLINYLVLAIPVASAFIVMGWVTTTISNGIAVRCSSDIIEGRQVSLKRGFNSALLSFSSLLGAGFITAVLIILGLVLFIIPGIIVAIMFSLAVQVIIIERTSASESLRKSRELVTGRWKKTFTVLFLVLLIVALSQLSAEFIGNSLGGYFSNIGWLITSILSSLAQPLHPIALTHLYYALRFKEGVAEPVPYLQPTVPAQPPTAYPDLRAFQPRFCYKCGQRLPSDAIYCPQCGASVRP